MTACRSGLERLQPKSDSHAGLLRDRRLIDHKETPKEQLLNALMNIRPSAVYCRAFARWRATAETRGCLTLTAETAGSLAVGLGNASPLENGLSIHHTYGMPALPGSSIKGVLRRAAERGGIKSSSPEFGALFGVPPPRAARAAADGDPEPVSAGESEAVRGTPARKGGSAGAAIFWDAWFDPHSFDRDPKVGPFHRDVITVHHQKYYGSRGAGENWPTDFDNPVPVPFLVVPPGAKFLFAVECPAPEWRALVWEMLVYALTEFGLGGKTNAGYGRFRVEDESGPAASASPSAARAPAGRTAAVAPQGAAAPAMVTWEKASVLRNAGTGKLIATNLDDRRQTAMAEGQEAPRILKTLNEDAAARLKKKAIEAEVDCKPVGNGFQLMEVRPK
ncbi:MAG TPA: type III-B CRISPR module RAMP protein Cmr6 [Chthonomonadaceae bacterium]|nr:type III-B CRISPR module RAMP protein Cmr6 [Chthonomonadaceae bacterium]